MSPSHPLPFLPVSQTYTISQFSCTELYSNALFLRTNEANHSLVHCLKHQNKIPSSFSSCKNYSWCTLLYCEPCLSYWSVCSMCPNSRVRMTNKKQCHRHHSKYHTSPVPSTNPLPQTHPTNMPFPTDMPTQLPHPSPIVALPILDDSIQVTSPNIIFRQRLPKLSREESHHYFTHNETDHLVVLHHLSP